MSMSGSAEGWGEAPLELRLEADEVHVWRAPLEETFRRVNPCELSEAEELKGRTLTNEAVRRQYLVSHWLTRHILSRYVLRMQPSRLSLAVGQNGKPRLLDALPGGELQFNRSHAAGWFVLAVSGSLPVGVDIEKIAERSHMAAIVKRWFEPAERGRFVALVGEEQLEFFYHCWTKKEAILKAWGAGLVELTGYALYEARSTHLHFRPVEDFTGVAALAGRAQFRLSCFSV
jgi:4'-phosphopantetheinyl transferase